MKNQTGKLPKITLPPKPISPIVTRKQLDAERKSAAERAFWLGEK